MNIEGKISTLRALEPEDLDAMYGWENDTDSWRVSGTVAPFSRHILSRLLDEQQFDIYATRQMRLVVERKSDGITVGAVDMFEFDPQNLRAGVGIIIAPPYRKQGFALDALQSLERYVRDVLRMHQLWCSVGADNEASLALFQKAGYIECGLRKEWLLTSNGAIDEVLMQKILK
ncbi:MAG: GNAT family N-acetyltransferase [Alistipes sp.]|nr:GNAT family N-acetyltransferase [Alistipes sp.]MBP3601243.1 GNAT family N-acetyltransferase [Alistipes sp.]